MVGFLTQEWLDVHRSNSAALSVAPGRSARIQFVIAGSPGGEVKVFMVVRDGLVTESSIGTDANADLTLTIKYPDAVSLLRGELDPNAAFMQGKIKVAGPTGPLLDLLALSITPERVLARSQLSAQTEA